MEINAINQLRRTAAWTPGKKAEAQDASGAAPKTDSLTLTEQSVERLREQSQRLAALAQQAQLDREAAQTEKKKPALWDLLDGEEESGSSEAEALGEQLKTVDRCQRIASRIMRGDKVPPEDERYLMENDPEGYKMALALRKPKKKPKKWESVLEDEEKKSEASREEETGETVEAAGETSGETAASGGDSGGSSGGDAPSSDGE